MHRPLSVAASALVLLSASAFAEDTDDAMKPRVRTICEAKFLELDIDQDGTLSRDEIVSSRHTPDVKAKVALFKQMDSDDNNEISKAEFLILAEVFCEKEIKLLPLKH